MGIFSSVVDAISGDFIDAYFVVSDLFDIPITDDEKFEMAVGDRTAYRGAEGITISDGHAYNSAGDDMGPVGKLSI